MTEFRPIDDTRYDAAAAWHARLEGVDGQVGEQDWMAFAAWLEEHPDNRLAFDAVSDAAAEVDIQKRALAAALSAHHSGDNSEDNVVSLDALRQSRSVPPPALKRRTALFGLGAAAAILIAVFAAPEFLRGPATRTWSTAVGGHQTVWLEDGSEIQLSTDTAVAVSFDRQSRTVHLQKGEAHFDVTPDPARPFVVMAGDRRIQVIGTAFDILKDNGKIAVTVARGIVQVAPIASSPAGTAVKLVAGDQYRGNEGQALFQVVKVDPEQALAWRNGRLIFEDAPLLQVIADLNRHLERKLVLADAETAALRFTGVLKLDDAQTVAKRLEGLLPLTVQTKGNDLVLQRGSSD